MDKAILLLAIGLSMVTAVADSLIKKATIVKSGSITVVLVLVGALMYLLTAFGWYKVFQKIELLNAGVIFTLSFILFITLVSVFYFKEKLLIIEVVGLLLAVVSIVILYRFH